MTSSSQTVQRWLHLEDDVRGIAGHRDRLVRRATAEGGVVITAPHALPHVRDGATKRADMWTGGLALLLAELTGAAAVVDTSGVGDASWDAEHPFKDAVAQLDPSVVVDLHAMRSTEQVVEIGSGAPLGGPPTPIAAAVREAIAPHGLATVVDVRFPARGQHTLVQWAARRGVPAVQLEVSVRLVPFFASDDDAARLVGALVGAVEASRATLASGPTDRSR